MSRQGVYLPQCKPLSKRSINGLIADKFRNRKIRTYEEVI